ncbi:Unknown protein, partial [Striga hermonthica]
NDHKNVTATMISNLLLPKIQKQVTYSVEMVQADVKSAWSVDVSYKKAWHGRKKAIERLYGTCESNFAQLPQFFAAEGANPGTVVEWEWQDGEMAHRSRDREFKFVFWAFGPAIRTFHLCPPIISIDGTHLR